MAANSEANANRSDALMEHHQQVLVGCYKNTSHIDLLALQVE